MKLGYFGIGSGPCADPEVAARVARALEDAGFESAWTGEHVVLPDPQAPPSPASPRFPMLHPAVALAYVAGLTRTLRLGTGIVILPQRNPVVLAKELASLDVVSGGRLEFGLGVGYLKPEFDALGVPFERRGARSDEYIDAIRALWTQEQPSFAGEFVSFSGIDARPRPVQQPTPPIVVGGHSPGALARAVARGDGWYGFALTPDAAQSCIDGLRHAERERGRPQGLRPLQISVTPAVPLDRDTARRYEDLGVDRLIPLSMERSPDALVESLEKLAAELLS